MICPSCKKEFETHRFGKRWVKTYHVRDLCYHCSFWDPWIRRKDEPGIARVRGVHYSIIADFEYSYNVNQGFLYVFEFFDGRTIVSANTHCQGAIPTRFNHVLPNNARLKKVPVGELEHLGCGALSFDDYESTVAEPEPIVERPKIQQSLFS